MLALGWQTWQITQASPNSRFYRIHVKASEGPLRDVQTDHNTAEVNSAVLGVVWGPWLKHNEYWPLFGPD